MVAKLSIFILIASLIFEIMAQSLTLWNPSTDPLPPLQPKEYGCATSTIDQWTATNNQLVLNVNAFGYIFGSYNYSIQMSQIAGSDQGESVMQQTVTNYSDTSNNANLQISFQTQSCNYYPVEGGSQYMGYDYYQILILTYYNMGIPIYFQYIDTPDFGVCLQWIALAPWSNPDLPRFLNYTLTFQNSTGYLLDYVLSGTEYCCYTTGTNYCPNEGNCSDGSAPQEIYVVSGTYYRNYSLFNNWPTQFFDIKCPFSSVPVVPTSSDSTICSNSGVSSAGGISGLVICFTLVGFVVGFFASKKCFLASSESDTSKEVPMSQKI